jgi:1-acyl-sn-glycerol-3-phosphate acyltransferase
MMGQRVRGAAKTAILVASLFECVLRFGWLRIRRQPTAQERAVWLHRCCLRITKRLGIRVDAHGRLPARGLVVSNHLSHLDILLYGSLGPVVFVSKKDVLSWPLLGQLAAFGGTVFVDRERGTQAAEAARQMEELLRGDLPVVLFPEGTSSDGTMVLPFRSPLFESAVRAGCPVTAAAIGYAADGVEESTLAYYGDKVFFPHLYETLGYGGLAVRIWIAGSSAMFIDRKEAARTAHRVVTALRKKICWE